jgi:hypothetical protein
VRRLGRCRGKAARPFPLRITLPRLDKEQRFELIATDLHGRSTLG